MATYNEIIRGLDIFARYTHNGHEAHLGGADHDVIYGLPLIVNVSDVDAARLEELGWHRNKSADCWVHYV